MDVLRRVALSAKLSRRRHQLRSVNGPGSSEAPRGSRPAGELAHHVLGQARWSSRGSSRSPNFGRYRFVVVRGPAPKVAAATPWQPGRPPRRRGACVGRGCQGDPFGQRRPGNCSSSGSNSTRCPGGSGCDRNSQARGVRRDSALKRNGGPDRTSWREVGTQPQTRSTRKHLRRQAPAPGTVGRRGQPRQRRESVREIPARRSCAPRRLGDAGSSP